MCTYVIITLNTHSTRGHTINEAPLPKTGTWLQVVYLDVATCAPFGSTAAVPCTYVDDGLALLAFKAAIVDDPLRALEREGVVRDVEAEIIKIVD